LFRRKLFLSWENFEEKESEIAFWRTVSEDVDEFLKGALA
tara:strand:- start:2196 stop:2315 length:120 start_codon:yes stop_codon:yes gene_type:complete